MQHIQCKSLLILILASWYQYRKYSTANIWPKCQSFPFVLVCPNITDMYFIGLLMWGKDQNDWVLLKVIIEICQPHSKQISRSQIQRLISVHMCVHVIIPWLFHLRVCYISLRGLIGCGTDMLITFAYHNGICSLLGWWVSFMYWCACQRGYLT